MRLLMGAQARWLMLRSSRSHLSDRLSKIRWSKMELSSWDQGSTTTSLLDSTIKEEWRWILSGFLLWLEALERPPSSHSLESLISMEQKLNITMSWLDCHSITVKCWWRMDGEKTWQEMRHRSLLLTVWRSCSAVTRKLMTRYRSSQSPKKESLWTSQSRSTPSGVSTGISPTLTRNSDQCASGSDIINISKIAFRFLS